MHKNISSLTIINFILFLKVLSYKTKQSKIIVKQKAIYLIPLIINQNILHYHNFSNTTKLKFNIIHNLYT